jgi:hypothetical protein
LVDQTDFVKVHVRKRSLQVEESEDEHGDAEMIDEDEAISDQQPAVSTITDEPPQRKKQRTQKRQWILW